MAIVKKQVYIVGSSFHAGATTAVAGLTAGQRLRLVREPRNKYDPNAIAVYVNQQMLGYVPKGLAVTVAPLMDKGCRTKAVKTVDPRMQDGAVMDMAWETEPHEASPDQGTNK